MATQETHAIVPADESEVHDEPHLEGHRITVRQIVERVEQRRRAAERDALERGVPTLAEDRKRHTE